MNAGLRALKKASPEAFEKITGKEAMYGTKTPMAEYGKKNMMGMGGMNMYAGHGMNNPVDMAEYGEKIMMGMGGMNMYADDGTKMPKELVEYFERKKAEYGMKVMGDGGKYYSHGGSHSGDSGDDEVAELSAQDALAFLAAQNPGMEVRGSTADSARSLFDGMGSTTAISSTATPTAGFVDPRGDVAPRETPVVTRPGSIDPLRRIGPRVMKREVEKGLVGGPREMSETEKESSFRGIYFAPSTSNIRAFIPTDDGSRTFGARGFEMEDRIPYGFRKDGKKIFATPEVFDKMKEEGVGARGASAEDFLMELYDKQPELFSESQSSRGIIEQRVLDEAKQRQPGVPGFYIPTSPLKASLGDGGRLYMQGGKMYGMGGMRPIKNYGHGGKNC